MTTPFPATSMPDRAWWAAVWPDPQATLVSLGVRPGMMVLDLCCGDGYFTAPLAKLVGGRVAALDLDPAMIERAKAEAAVEGVSIERWICADARDIAEYLPGPVDYVLMANTFHGVPDQPGLAIAIRAILRQKGRLAILNWRQRPRETTVVLGQPRGPATALRMSPEQVRAVVEPAGFRFSECFEIGLYHYGIVFETV